MDQRALNLVIDALSTSDPRFGDLVEGTRVSGYELLDDAWRIANMLAVRSRRDGSGCAVVAVMGNLSREFLAWVIGTHLASGIAAPLYPMLRPKECDTVLSLLRPDVIVANSDQGGELSGYAFDPDFGAFIAEHPPERQPLPQEADLVLFSSGSTGESKGILLNGTAILRSATSFGERLGITPGARYFCPLPMAHSGGLIMGWWASALQGAVMLGSATSNFDVVARRLTEVRPEIVGAVDTFFYRWAQATGGRSALGRVAWSTGDKRTLELVQRGCGFEHVVRPYGLTEASPNVGVGDPNRNDGTPADSRIWVHDGVNVKIDVTTVDDEPGLGEILVSGACVSPGYLTPEGVVPVADDDGWIHTGDLGYFEPDGSMQYVGRLKEMLKVGGLNVWPQEIEAVLQEIDIKNSICVVGRRDDEYGELPVLVVEGSLSDGERKLVAKALSTLPRIKQPRDILYFEAFPVTASGKMDRRTITKLTNDR